MLELSSNTIKVLGIFGRLSPDLESFLNNIEKQYSHKPEGDIYNIFRHLTLTFIPNASVTDIRKQLDLLRDLNQFLPLKIKVNEAIIKEEESMPGAEHVAVTFNLSETKELVEFVRKRAGETTVATWYIKLIWFVPKKYQNNAIKELSQLKELEFTDFYLCANKQDEVNTIYSTQYFSL